MKHGALVSRVIWPRRCSGPATLAASPLRASISTLVPERLRPTDFVDWSGIKQPACQIDSSSDPVATIAFTSLYGAQRRRTRIPFPSGTRGFLYCHVTDPAHPVANELRFRVIPGDVSNPQTAFTTGEDLVVSPGIPWSLRAIKIARSRALHASLATLLLRDRLVSQQAVDHWVRLPRAHLHHQTPVLCRLNQPFVHNLDASMHVIYVANKLDLHRVCLPAFIRDSRASFGMHPYSGSVLCCLESGMSAGGDLVAHVRVLRAISPIAIKDPSYDGYVPMPAVRELLRRPDGTPVELQTTGTQSALAILLRDAVTL